MSSSAFADSHGNTGLFITAFGRTPKSGMDCDFARGGFQRDPDVQFEVLMDDTSNELCFVGTRIRKLRLTTVHGTILYSWPDTFRRLPDCERLWLLIGDLTRSLDEAVRDLAADNPDYVVARIHSLINKLLEQRIRKSLIVSVTYEVLVGMVSGDAENPKAGL